MMQTLSPVTTKLTLSLLQFYCLLQLQKVKETGFKSPRMMNKWGVVVRPNINIAIHSIIPRYFRSSQ